MEDTAEPAGCVEDTEWSSWLSIDCFSPAKPAVYSATGGEEKGVGILGCAGDADQREFVWLECGSQQLSVVVAGESFLIELL